MGRSDNARKVEALSRDQHVGRSLMLYRRATAGPSGQRRNTPVGAVRYLPDGPYEFEFLNPADPLDRMGFAARRGDGWMVWEQGYEGGIRLKGFASSLAIAADVLAHGEGVAKGRHDSERTSGGTWVGAR